MPTAIICHCSAVGSIACKEGEHAHRREEALVEALQALVPLQLVVVLQPGGRQHTQAVKQTGVLGRSDAAGKCRT